MRATAAAWLSGALALAAHSTAGGGPPSAHTFVLLAVLCCTLAGLVARWRRAADTRVLMLMLACTQVLAHLLQSGHGHSHHSWSSTAMAAAHAVAAACCAVLVAACDRLRAALSAAVRVCLRLAQSWPRAVDRLPQPCVDAIWSDLSFLTVRSYRGPPAAV